MMKTAYDALQESGEENMATACEAMGLKHRHQGGVDAIACPSCALPVVPDMLVDVSMAPAEMRGEMTWLCSGCLDGWYHQGKGTRGEISAALGAPVDSDHAYWTQPAQRRGQSIPSDAQG